MGRLWAIIDLGTNSARLLVAEETGEGAWRPVATDRIACRLGEDLAATGRIDPEAEARTARALVILIERARAVGDVTLRVLATHALRAARNGVAVQGRLEDHIGMRITSLSGEREAHLVLRAAQQLVAPGADEPLVALDLGGGSLEFAVQLQHPGRDLPARLVSLPLGAVVLAQGVSSGIVSAFEIGSLQERVRAVLVEHVAWVRGLAQRVVTSGGTAVCVAALLGHAPPWNGVRFPVEALSDLRDRLAAMEGSQRAALPAVGDRADIIVPGLVVLQEALQHVGATQGIVLEQGVREGALLALMQDEL